MRRTAFTGGALWGSRGRAFLPLAPVCEGSGTLSSLSGVVMSAVAMPQYGRSARPLESAQANPLGLPQEAGARRFCSSVLSVVCSRVASVSNCTR
jgi:hypothetical protein